MIDRSLRKHKHTETETQPVKKKKKVEMYFVRNRTYADALKEADQKKAEGWTVRNWHYEATTMTFVILLTRLEGYVKPEEKKEETENKESAGE